METRLARRRIVHRIVQKYWRLTRGLTLGAQGIVIDQDDRVLLIRHTYRPGWHFPGGGVEKNETVVKALERELEEETGVLMAQSPELLGIYTNFRAFPSDHILLFTVRHWTQPMVPPPNHEIAEQGFFARDSLPVGVVEPVRRRLAELFEGAERTSTW